MANERYNFKYLPLTGKLPGKSMVEQTETAINELASVVYDNVGHVGNLAEEVQTANTNASNALDKATEALETSGRVYIKQIAAVDVNDYYDSELYYIDNDGSTNIPVRDRGFLEVKTNDDKTACEQVFIADSTGTPYYRYGRITEQTLGEETTYVVTWGSWYQCATTEYVQAELQDYLPLSGGTVTGEVNINGADSEYVIPLKIQCPTLSAGHGIFINLGKEASTYNRYSFGFHYVGNNSTSNYFSFASFDGPSYNFDCAGNATFPKSLTVPTVKGNLAGNADTATNATNDANGSPIAGTYLPLAGGTMTGSIQYVENGKVFSIGNTDPGNVDLGWNWDNREGAGFGLRSADHLNNPGEFSLFARDSANSCSLEGKPDGSLTWGGISLTDGTFIKVQQVQIPVASGTDLNVGNATAPAISGYEFVAWIYTTSNGNVYPCYCSNVVGKTTSVWVPSSHRSIANGTQISCYALYVRKW